jgi:hypothetical protein
MTRRPARAQTRPLSASHSRADLKADGRWILRTLPGASAVQTYRCPGCQADIRPGTAHLVAWPDDPGWMAESGVEQRRHWHTSCWQRRP